ncbi:DUF1269 domain-containing protein [Lyngbya aestuarii]|uniref:DUF1269 domain-containing protein n=1 Tax=Lyngbya aestuarii TaxID=118322 RepID=UPI00403E0C6C
MLEKENFAPRTGSYKRAVGVFKKQEDLESALHALKGGGFDMDRVSLLARNVEDVEGAREVTEKHGNEAKEGAGIGATTGTVLGGVGGFLVGVGLLAIPGVGPILAAGAEISALASTLAGAGIGAAAGGIIGALIGLGIPEERAKVYNERVKAGDYLLMVSGNDDEVRRAQSIMRERNVEEFDIFDAPDRNRAQAEAIPAAERRQVREEVRPMPTAERRQVREETVTETRDLTGDGDPEVIIVDKNKRREVR